MALSFAFATERDLPEIISLLADDELGQSRENSNLPLDERYTKAFQEIEHDPHNELILAQDGNRLVGVLQLTFIPNLTLMGTKRAQIEGVRVASSHRGKGVGRKLFEFALNRAREKGCGLAQLTTNRARPEAFRFYEALGFQATHVGFKCLL